MARIVCIGEGMVELSRQSDGWKLGHGGDVLNTAIHLARAGHDVALLTALGSDSFSTNLRRSWAREGLDCSMVLTHPTRHVGLYAVDVDGSGERSFTYWRNASAAREMFALDGIDQALIGAKSCDLLYFSLITLAILPANHRRHLLELASLVRTQGGKVAFDGNYRPRLWSGVAEARDARDAAIGVASIGLPTLDDEAAISRGATAESVAMYWSGLGCTETVVKLGEQGCRLPDGTILAPDVVLQPVDTSGAGDAFNGGYLAARVNGVPIEKAAPEGQFLAAQVIMHAGAIPDVPERRGGWNGRS